MIGSRDPISGEWIDPDDAPEWTDEMFATAEYRANGVVIRPATHKLGPGGKLIPVAPGRPKLDDPKRQVTLRLDGIVLERFRATGPGWQTRINEALRKAVGFSDTFGHAEAGPQPSSKDSSAVRLGRPNSYWLYLRRSHCSLRFRDARSRSLQR